MGEGGPSAMTINDKLVAYLNDAYVPATFPAASLASLIEHHLTTLTGTTTDRWLTMLEAADAFI